MRTIDTVVIGAGHAGLAVSRELTVAGRDHVVLDRGRVGESWRQRWDSLHLLTPNWMTRLPGWVYTGRDQEGYMSTRRLVDFLEQYADSFAAPVHAGTTVTAVSKVGNMFVVGTDRGTWRAAQVVIATGPFGRPHVPAPLQRLHPDLVTLPSSRYRNPRVLGDGGVLVVGASSSGMQIADELARSGRRVILAVGRHTRMPRRYRGMDIFWWLERTGRLARTIDEVRDPDAARREPSMQLVGHNHPSRYGEDLDLAALQRQGVRLAGRVVDADGHRVRFDDDLAERAAESDRRMHRFLDTVDRHVQETGLTAEVWAPTRPRPVRITQSPRRVDLRAEGIGTVLLATGYRPPAHPWLRLPVTTPAGDFRQHSCVTPVPGLYVVGQRFGHRRDASFIDGARFQARAVVDHLCSAADTTARRAG